METGKVQQAASLQESAHLSPIPSFPESLHWAHQTTEQVSATFPDKILGLLLLTLIHKPSFSPLLIGSHVYK